MEKFAPSALASSPPTAAREPRLATATAIAAVGALAAIVLAILFGSETTSVHRAWIDLAGLDGTILLRLRAPRVAVAALAGGGLAAAGAALQALLRNPLAEPYVLGVSGGAALGATAALLAGLGGVAWFGAGLVPLAAFLGGVAATALVARFVRRGTLRGEGILLAGFVVNALASAAITLAKTIVDANRAQELLFWLTGFVDVPTSGELVALAAGVLIGVAGLVRLAPALGHLAFGDDVAESLGIDVPRVERQTLLLASLVTGSIVAVTGLVAFVGLVVPQVLRRLVGSDPRKLVPLSFFAGAGLLPLCDLASRLAVRLFHTGPPVGAITALLGGPVFLVLLLREKRERS